MLSPKLTEAFEEKCFGELKERKKNPPKGCFEGEWGINRGQNHLFLPSRKKKIVCLFWQQGNWVEQISPQVLKLAEGQAGMSVGQKQKGQVCSQIS